MANLSKIQLQAGLNLQLENGFIFRQPTVQDIVLLKDEVYFWFMMAWCKKPHDSIHQLYRLGIDFQKITEEEYLDSHISENETAFLQMLIYFSNLEKCGYFYVPSEECKMIHGILEDGREIILSFDDMCSIKKYISDIHFFKSITKRKFDDYETMKVIIEYEIEEMEFQYKEGKNIDVSNIVSSVVSRNQRTWDYVFGLTVYRLYDELYRAMKIDEVNQLLNGIYSGSIDSSKVDKSNLSWLS